MDIVFIRKFSVYTCVGTLDWEKNIKQKLIFDLDMAWDNRKPGCTDNLNDALNYIAVSKVIQKYLVNRNFSLIERVAEEIAKLIMVNFKVSWIRVKIIKPEAISSDIQVGVQIERGVFLNRN